MSCLHQRPGASTAMIARIVNSLLPRLTAALIAITLSCGPAFAGTDEMGDFEAALKENFPGSYTLYASLSGDSQQRVYKEYKKNSADLGIGRFSKVIAKILELVIEEGGASPLKTVAPRHS